MSDLPRIRIDGRTTLFPDQPGWPGAWSEAVGPAAGGGLGLVPRAEGPMGLASRDDTLGGLLLPRSVAVDESGRVYLLSARGGTLLALDPGARRFRPLLRDDAGIGLQQPSLVRVVAGRLWLADPKAGRIVVFDVAAGVPLAKLAVASPVDLACSGGRIYVLDRGSGIVYRVAASLDRLRPVLITGRTDQLDRLVVAPDGTIYLKQDDARWLLAFSAQGDPLPPLTSAEPLRGLLPTPPRPDGHGHLQVGDRLFDAAGEPVQPDPTLPVASDAYPRHGHWISRPLDAGRDDTRWHRVDIVLTAFPAGSRLKLASLSANRPQLEGRPAEDLEPETWDPLLEVTAPASGGGALRIDGRVQSQPGRYLWLRIELAGRGDATPILASIELYHDGRRLVDLLPAVYHEEVDGRRFLERYFDLIGQAFAGVETGLAGRYRLFDPRFAPAERLGAIARLLDVPFEARLDEAGLRRLLYAARANSARRGTPAGLRARVGAVLSAFTGLPPESQLGYPQLIEGFAERAGPPLDQPTASLDGATPLAGASEPEEGLRLKGPFPPEQEGFAEAAFRVSVVVPAVWASPPEREQILERTIAKEVPAHVAWRLVLARPSTVLDGSEARLDIHTILGGARPLSLGESSESPPDVPRLDHDAALAPERSVSHRLGSNGLPLDARLRL